MLLRDAERQTPANEEFLRLSEELWNSSPDPINEKLETFTRYVSRETITKFLARAELFSKQLHVHGSIIELGVARGAGLFTWLHLSSILEPVNYIREIVGFDTFAGFPTVGIQDTSTTGASAELRTGGFSVSCSTPEDIEAAARLHDATRFLGHIPKVRLVQGPIEQTLPSYLQANPHSVISLLNIDVDVFSATKIALTLLLPRIPKGGIIIFDEVNDRRFPGETIALHEVVGICGLELRRMPFCPTLSYAVVA